MKAFVTGSTGFIGSHLVEFLLGEGIEVFALVRHPGKLKWLKGLNTRVLKGNLFSIPPLPADIDCVFHCAALTKAPNLAAYYTVNKLGTASLFQSLRSQKIFPRVISLSSIAAAGPSIDNIPVQEEDPPHPLTPYGMSKLEGEKEALKFREEFPVVILRAGAVFGPRDRDFLQFFKYIKMGILPKLGKRPHYVSLCYVRDLIEALYRCGMTGLKSGEIIHIADSHPFSWEEFGAAAGRIMGKKLLSLVIPPPLAHFMVMISELTGKISGKTPALNRHKFEEMKQEAWIADVVKAEKILSFKTRFSLEQALAETLGWYRENGWL